MNAAATSDQAAIRAIVDRMEGAWNRGDGHGFAVDMAEDVDFIDVLGRHHHGREVVGEGHAQMFVSFYRGSRMAYEVEGVRFVRPDVALAFLRARLTHGVSVAINSLERETAPAGEPKHDTIARPTLTLAKDDGRWQVVSSQNTVVAPPPSA